LSKLLTLENAPPWAIALLETARVAHLALLDDDDHPRVLPVTFALADGALWTAVDWKPKRAAEPARVRFLRRNPRTALTVDEYDDDWSRLAWVQVLGHVEVLEEGPGLDALVSKYAQYAERPPGGPFLRLKPVRLLCWRANG
jgi:PPOX class probable F420-dependent enzyme